MGLMKHLFLPTTAALMAGSIWMSQARSQSTPMTSPSSMPGTAASASPSPSSVAQGPLDVLNDISALNYLHHVNNLEIQEATQAEPFVQSPTALNLVQTMLSDHQKSEQAVVQLAASKNIALFVFQPTAYENAADAYLSTLNDTVFDTAFLQLEKQDHQVVLQQLQTYQAEVKDPDIKNLISQTIPVVQRHIEIASGGIIPSPSPSPSASFTPST